MLRGEAIVLLKIFSNKNNRVQIQGFPAQLTFHAGSPSAQQVYLYGTPQSTRRDQTTPQTSPGGYEGNSMQAGERSSPFRSQMSSLTKL